MRNFMRSTPMKVVLFIVYAISVLLSVLSVAGIAYFSMDGFYGKTQSDLTEQKIKEEIMGDLPYYADRVKEALYPDGESDVPQYSYGIESFPSDGTNLRLTVYNSRGATVAENTEGYLSLNSAAWEYTFYFSIEAVCRQEFSDEKIYVLGFVDEFCYETDGDIYTVKCYLPDKLTVNDRYFTITEHINKLYPYRNYPIAVLAVAAFFVVVSSVCLIVLAGRRPNSDGLHPGRFYRLPLDLLTAALAAVTVFVIAFFSRIYWWWGTGEIISLIFVFWLLSLFFIGFVVSVSVRIKGGTVIKNTVIYRLVKLILKLVRTAAVHGRIIYSALPLIWRTAVAVGCYLVIEALFLFLSWGVIGAAGIILLWIFEKLIFIPLVLLAAVLLRRLEAGGRAIAEGDVGYHVDTGAMFGAVKKHGENLNSIADGMAAAVEKRMQSERMKTDLITNVSHDIKTPLTSIINYSNLIAEKECSCPEHKEYADVLLRKSESLRRLLEDVVEVSKASSGNLDVELVSCDAGVLLTQAAGEFGPLCRAADLELVTSQPAEPVEIMADSRRIWRVFENLLGNAVKYSLPGSRVYLALTADGDNAVFTFRNTSRAQLNISPKELMERFVRGDSARSGEGNGLGLSISESLTELQGGKMELSIDGDLFKVTLTFPKVR